MNTKEYRIELVGGNELIRCLDSTNTLAHAKELFYDWVLDAGVARDYPNAAIIRLVVEDIRTGHASTWKCCPIR